jgi:hypothetical protein
MEITSIENDHATSVLHIVFVALFRVDLPSGKGTQKQGSKLINILIYMKLISTPTKFHYIFFFSAIIFI